MAGALEIVIKCSFSAYNLKQVIKVRSNDSLDHWSSFSVCLSNEFIYKRICFLSPTEPTTLHTTLDSCTISISYLFYPLLGWLSDVYFTRYKVIRLSFLLGTVVLATVAIVGVGIKVGFAYSYHKAELALAVLSVPTAFIHLRAL